jgi:NAD-dependent protein deacetylase/lipoamidase
LHSAAGLPDAQIVELHGSNRQVLCLNCDRTYDPDEIMARLVGDFASPKCDSCGGILKSATVSFGQAMPEQAMRTAHQWAEQADVFIVMGSSLQVQPAASFPLTAHRNGAVLAIVNREPGPLDEVADFVHHGGIGEFCARFGEMIADG